LSEDINKPDRTYRKILQGDEEAFRKLFEELAKPLVFFGLKLTGNKEQAEDAASEAFQILWQKRESLQSFAAMRSFLYTVVHRTCVDYLRHKKVVDSAVSELMQVEASSSDMDARIIQAETMLAIHEAIEALPSHHREIIRQSFAEELSSKAIAARHGKTEAHVRTARARAIAALRNVLRKRGLLEAALLCWDFWQKK
jgi:RNA polymerase sigma factor (sigma-70 family)